VVEYSKEEWEGFHRRVESEVDWEEGVEGEKDCEVAACPSLVARMTYLIVYCCCYALEELLR
jgi:hypothetical protein